MARSADDYGISGLDEATLRELSGNVRRYGEKGRFASQELGQRRGLMGDADAYRAAIQRATYQQLSPEFSQGLSQITRGLAGAGPMADSGGANALRIQLGNRIYGQAAGQVGGKYSDYLGNLLEQRRQFMYQRQLEQMRQKGQKTGVGGILGGIVGTGIGALAGGYGYGLGSRLAK